MNDSLMKQFQPMFSEDRAGSQNRQENSNALLNSVSDFSQINEDGGLLKSQGGGNLSRAQLFAQAKETLMAQKRGS